LRVRRRRRRAVRPLSCAALRWLLHHYRARHPTVGYLSALCATWRDFPASRVGRLGALVGGCTHRPGPAGGGPRLVGLEALSAAVRGMGTI